MPEPLRSLKWRFTIVVFDRKFQNLDLGKLKVVLFLWTSCPCVGGDVIDLAGADGIHCSHVCQWWKWIVKMVDEVLIKLTALSLVVSSFFKVIRVAFNQASTGHYIVPLTFALNIVEGVGISGGESLRGCQASVQLF